jgi:hypothetical protein
MSAVAGAVDDGGSGKYSTSDDDDDDVDDDDDDDDAVMLRATRRCALRSMKRPTGRLMGATLLAADASASTGRKPGVGCCSDGLLTPYTAIKACSEKHDWVSREGVGVGVASRGRASNDASMQHAP